MLNCKECGKEITASSKSGLCRSCVMKGKRNPFFGRRLSKESRAKIGAKNNGKNHPMYGKHHSIEIRTHLSNINKGKIFSDEHRAKIRASTIKHRREHPELYTHYGVSKCETTFLNKIEELYTIKFDRQFKLEDRLFDGRYNNILIECDGSYWHDPVRRGDNVWWNDLWKNILAKKYNYKIYRFRVDTAKEGLQQIILNKGLFDTLFIPTA